MKKNTGYLVSLLVAASMFAVTVVNAKEKSAIPELDCVIEPSAVVDAGSSIPGLIESISVDRSDLISAGEVLAKLESSVEKAALQRARAQAKSTAGVELREESLKLGKLTEQRNTELYNIAAISKQDMEQLQSESRIAELQVKQEKHNQKVAQLEYQRARAALDRLTIRSPIDGVVTDRFKAVGEYVEDEPVLRIAQLDPLFIEVVVPVEHLGAIRAGMQAKVTPTAGTNAEYHAVVERVDRVADAASGTYGVRLKLPNSDYEIPAGLRCRIAFEIQGDEHNALAGSSIETDSVATDAANPNPWVLGEKEQVTGASKPPVVQAIPQPAGVQADAALKVESAESVAGPTMATRDESNSAEIAGKTAQKTSGAIALDNIVANKAVPNSEPPAPQAPAAVSGNLVEKLLQAALAQADINERIPAPAITAPSAITALPSKNKAIEACYSIGPVTTERLAHQVAGQVAGHMQSNNREQLIRQLREEKSRVVKGYYVLAEPTNGNAETGALLDKLNNINVSDHMLIETGKYKNRVSLGYFHQNDSARHRMQAMSELGFTPSLIEHYGTTKQYWLDFSGPDHRELKSELKAIASSAAPSASLQALECSPTVASR